MNKASHIEAGEITTWTRLDILRLEKKQHGQG